MTTDKGHEQDGTAGQDRESYTDEQDRKSYAVHHEEGPGANPVAEEAVADDDEAATEQAATERLYREYLDAMHAMQTGVAVDLSHDDSSGTPKHLRVGVNAALADHGSLVRLLVAKGVITHEEYLEAIRDGMRAEADKYQDMLRERLGGNITLH